MQCIPPEIPATHAGRLCRETPSDPSGWRNVSMRPRVRENNDTRGSNNRVTTRRPLGQAQTGGDYSWISMAIWIIYWTVSLDTTSQSHVIYWHPPPFPSTSLPWFYWQYAPFPPIALLVPSPWRPVYPLSLLIRIGISVETVKNVFSSPPIYPFVASFSPLLTFRFSQLSLNIIAVD